MEFLLLCSIILQPTNSICSSGGITESFKKSGLPVKRLNLPYPLTLRFLEGFPVSMWCGFTAAKGALQTRCLRLVLLKRAPTLACLIHICRAGDTE